MIRNRNRNRSRNRKRSFTKQGETFPRNGVDTSEQVSKSVGQEAHEPLWFIYMALACSTL